MSFWPAEVAQRAPLNDFPPAWASAWGDDRYGLWADLVVEGHGIKATQRMRWIEPSQGAGFWMGSSKKERRSIKDKDVREWADRSESEPRLVPVPQGFWLADTPCTQAFWTAVMGENPSSFQEGVDAPRRPVENVSWDDVERFVLTFAATPASGTDGRLCLPTEIQWEYACRAYTASAYWWGDAPDNSKANWYGQNRGTTPVDRYPPNPWGLYDMHGNVWEWCRDPWRQRLDDPRTLAEQRAFAVRGGSWFDHPGIARAAYRGGGRAGRRLRDLGFRFALRSSSPGTEGGA